MLMTQSPDNPAKRQSENSELLWCWQNDPATMDPANTHCLYCLFGSSTMPSRSLWPVSTVCLLPVLTWTRPELALRHILGREVRGILPWPPHFLLVLDDCSSWDFGSGVWGRSGWVLVLGVPLWVQPGFWRLPQRPGQFWFPHHSGQLWFLQQSNPLLHQWGLQQLQGLVGKVPPHLQRGEASTRGQSLEEGSWGQEMGATVVPVTRLKLASVPTMAHRCFRGLCRCPRWLWGLHRHPNWFPGQHPTHAGSKDHTDSRVGS